MDIEVGIRTDLDVVDDDTEVFKGSELDLTFKGKERERGKEWGGRGGFRAVKFFISVGEISGVWKVFLMGRKAFPGISD